MGRLSTLQMCNIATRPFSKDMKCWLENQLVGSGFFKIAGHPNNHPWKDGIVSLDQKEEDRIGFFSVHPPPPIVLVPSHKAITKSERRQNWNLKLKKTNGVKMSIPPFQRIIQRWFLKDSQWMNKLLDDANAMEV